MRDLTAEIVALIEADAQVQRVGHSAFGLRWAVVNAEALAQAIIALLPTEKEPADVG